MVGSNNFPSCDPSKCSIGNPDASWLLFSITITKYCPWLFEPQAEGKVAADFLENKFDMERALLLDKICFGDVSTHQCPNLKMVLGWVTPWSPVASGTCPLAEDPGSFSRCARWSLPADTHLWWRGLQAVRVDDSHQKVSWSCNFPVSLTLPIEPKTPFLSKNHKLNHFEQLKWWVCRPPNDAGKNDAQNKVAPGENTSSIPCNSLNLFPFCYEGR